MKIYIATLSTTHFEFVAVGADREDAVKAMELTMRKHADDYQFRANQFIHVWKDQIEVDEVEVGNVGVIR